MGGPPLESVKRSGRLALRFRSYHDAAMIRPSSQPGDMVDYSNIPRDSRRVPLETRVQFKFDRFDGFISEYSANISPGGLFLRTRAPQPPGTVLDFEFRLGDGFELIRGRGEVVWNRLEDEGAGAARRHGAPLPRAGRGEQGAHLPHRRPAHPARRHAVRRHPAPSGSRAAAAGRRRAAAAAVPAAAPGPAPASDRRRPGRRPATFSIGRRETREPRRRSRRRTPPRGSRSVDEPGAGAGAARRGRAVPRAVPGAARRLPPAEAPPMFAATFGHAAARRPPRRAAPLVAAGGRRCCWRRGSSCCATG